MFTHTKQNVWHGQHELKTITITVVMGATMYQQKSFVETARRKRTKCARRCGRTMTQTSNTKIVQVLVITRPVRDKKREAMSKPVFTHNATVQHKTFVTFSVSLPLKNSKKPPRHLVQKNATDHVSHSQITWRREPTIKTHEETYHRAQRASAPANAGLSPTRHRPD